MVVTVYIQQGFQLALTPAYMYTLIYVNSCTGFCSQYGTGAEVQHRILSYSQKGCKGVSFVRLLL